MDCHSLLFVFSVSMQAAGALVLMISFWNNINHEKLKVIYSSVLIAYRNSDNNVIIPSMELYKATRHIWMNRIAFVYLAMGYILGVFGSNGGHWLYVIVLLLAFMILLILLSILVSSIIAKKNAKEDKFISYEELCSILGRDVPTNVTIDEIDEIFNK